MSNWAGQWAVLKKKENLRKAKNNRNCNARKGMKRKAKSANRIDKMPIISAKGCRHILIHPKGRQGVVHNMIR